MKRYPDGWQGNHFFQKQAPSHMPTWIKRVPFPASTRQGEKKIIDYALVDDELALLWMVNMGCIDLHAWSSRADRPERPDWVMFDLDPSEGSDFDDVITVARLVKETLDLLELDAYPKTSGSRGIHVNVRIHARWSFTQVRRAALALARDVERRVPDLATSKWWKEERHGVFLDYNQNAKDRTVAGAYSVRPTPNARVSAPVTWEELFDCVPEDFTLRTMPTRFAAIGDRHAGIDQSPCSLERLLELSARQEAEGLGDAPWPPHYAKQADEPPRVQPSRRRSGASPSGRRQPAKPLVEIGRGAKKADVLAGLERWKARHADSAAHLQPADVLVDAMRGRHTTWFRVRVNLEHVPEALRPGQEALDPDYDPWAHASGSDRGRARRARREA